VNNSIEYNIGYIGISTLSKVWEKEATFWGDEDFFWETVDILCSYISKEKENKQRKRARKLIREVGYRIVNDWQEKIDDIPRINSLLYAGLDWLCLLRILMMKYSYGDMFINKTTIRSNHMMSKRKKKEELKNQLGSG
jgi:hypothetical protein